MNGFQVKKKFVGNERNLLVLGEKIHSKQIYLVFEAKLLLLPIKTSNSLFEHHHHINVMIMSIFQYQY